MTCRWGIARNVASCSIGWCVGPSSPTPTESWVHTKTTLAWLSDAEAHARPHVVEEDEERAAGGQHATVLRHADHRGSHRVLADAVVHLAAAGMFERLRLLAGQLGTGVAGEVGGADEQAGHTVERCIERLLDGDTGRDLLALLERGQCGFPSGDAGSAPTRVPRRLVDAWMRPCASTIDRTRRRRARPHSSRYAATRSGGCPERLVGDAHDGLGAGDLLGGERVAVRLVTGRSSRGSASRCGCAGSAASACR